MSTLPQAFSPGGRRVLSGGAGEIVHLRGIDSGKERRRFDGHRLGVTSVAFSADGRRVLTAGR